ncbi:hypothetical protein, partial [Klebsiella pneumoniae]|uniref:hypothetical protein n=1 Tax=Klebsiella pneumoniae TaxID=573 RepID=UPI003EE3C0C3
MLGAMDRDARARLALSVTAGAAVLVWYFVRARAAWFVIDDAFIAYRYADNLVHGAGAVFNAGERV